MRSTTGSCPAFSRNSGSKPAWSATASSCRVRHKSCAIPESFPSPGFCGTGRTRVTSCHDGAFALHFRYSIVRIDFSGGYPTLYDGKITAVHPLSGVLFLPGSSPKITVRTIRTQMDAYGTTRSGVHADSRTRRIGKREGKPEPAPGLGIGIGIGYALFLRCLNSEGEHPSRWRQ